MMVQLGHAAAKGGMAVETHAGTDARVLVVDDEGGVRELMARWLQSGGYEVATASNSDEALHAMQETPAAVALCDIRMPGRDGLWLAGQLRTGFPDTAIIMATGVQEVGCAVASLRQGVVDYLMKPFGRDRLREAVLRGLEWHRSAVEARRWQDALTAEMQARQAQLAEALSSLTIESAEAVDGLLAGLTIRDRMAYEHAYRVAALSVALARTLGLEEAETGHVERAAILHEIGKMALPDAVRRKPAPLAREEQELVRRHPETAYALLAPVPFLAVAGGILRALQEWCNGAGYPRGLAGDAIPIGSRIIAVADAFDTMTRARVFRDALAPEEALLEIARCRGTQFDAEVVDALERIGPLVLTAQGGH